MAASCTRPWSASCLADSDWLDIVEQVSHLVGLLCGVGHLAAADVCEMYSGLLAACPPGVDPARSSAQPFETSVWCTTYTHMLRLVRPLLASL